MEVFPPQLGLISDQDAQIACYCNSVLFFYFIAILQYAIHVLIPVPVHVYTRVRTRTCTRYLEYMNCNIVNMAILQ